jgi:hypothetical protein
MRPGTLFLALVALTLAAPSRASAKSKQMECFSGFHDCMRENKGQMKMCIERRDACMKGDKKTSGKSKKRVKKNAASLHMDCSKKYTTCRQEKKGRKICRTKRQRCLRGEVEEEAAPVKNKVKKNPKKKAAKRKKRKLRENTGPKDSPCWTINMAMENCRGHAKKGCKGYNGSFDSEVDCTRCLTEHRMPMKLHQPMIFSSRDKIKKCKAHKKDQGKLKACIKTIKNRQERRYTQRYYDAQVEVDKDIAEAKSSGIKGCGDFTKMY